MESPRSLRNLPVLVLPGPWRTLCRHQSGSDNRGMFARPSSGRGFASPEAPIPLRTGALGLPSVGAGSWQVSWSASGTLNSQREQNRRDWAQQPHSSCRTSPALSPKPWAAALAPAPAAALVGTQEVPHPPGEEREGMRGEWVPLPCWPSSAPPAGLSCC